MRNSQTREFIKKNANKNLMNIEKNGSRRDICCIIIAVSRASFPYKIYNIYIFYLLKKQWLRRMN